MRQARLIASSWKTNPVHHFLLRHCKHHELPDSLQAKYDTYSIRNARVLPHALIELNSTTPDQDTTKLHFKHHLPLQHPFLCAVMDDSGNTVDDPPSSTGSVSKCIVCGLKFGLWTQTQRNAHINHCLDSLREESPDSGTLRPGDLKSGGKASMEPFEMCPSCGKDWSFYTEARRVQHANRCVDHHNDLEDNDKKRKRPPVVPELVMKRRSSSLHKTKSTTPTRPSTERSYSNHPPPATMDMIGKDYDCPVCLKALPGDFKSRVNHVSSCTTKHGINADKLEQLKREQTARLTAERMAWFTAHPEYPWEECSPSTDSLAFPLIRSNMHTSGSKSLSSTRSKRKHASAAITAHLQQTVAETALQPFFPSQLLIPSLPATDSSLEDPVLTWQNESLTREAETEVEDSEGIPSGFHLSEDPPLLSQLTKGKSSLVSGSRPNSSRSTSSSSTPSKLPNTTAISSLSCTRKDSVPTTQTPAKSSLAGIYSPDPKGETMGKKPHNNLIALPPGMARFQPSESFDEALLDASFSPPSLSPRRLVRAIIKRPRTEESEDDSHGYYSSSPDRDSGALPSKKPKLRENQFVHSEVIVLDSQSQIDSGTSSPHSGSQQPHDHDEGHQNLPDQTYSTSTKATPINSHYGGTFPASSSFRPAEETRGVDPYNSQHDSNKYEDEEYEVVSFSPKPKRSVSDGLVITTWSQRQVFSSTEADERPTTSSPPPSPSNRTSGIRSADRTPPLDAPGSSPPTPPLNINSSNHKGASIMDDFIDLTSPARPGIPLSRITASSAVNGSAVVTSPILATRLEFAPRPSSSIEPSASSLSVASLLTTPLSRSPTMPGIATASSSSGNAMTSTASPFDQEVDSLVSRFKLLEQQAEDAYYAALGRLAVQKEQQVIALARTYGIDASIAKRTLLNRSALLIPEPDPSESISVLTDGIGSRMQPVLPLTISVDRHQTVIETHDVAPTTVLPDLVRRSSLQEASAPTRKNSSLVPASLTTTEASSIPSSRQDSNAPPQRPKFETMSNEAITALATKFGLDPSNVSRTALISQLEAIWDHYKRTGPTIVSSSASDSSGRLSRPLTGSRNLSTRLASSTSNGVNAPNSTKDAAETSDSTSAPAAKRTRAKKGATASAGPVLTTAEKIDDFIKSNEDLYSSILHYAAVDVIELQASLKTAKIRCSRVELQEHLQKRSILYTNKKAAKATAHPFGFGSR